MAKRVPVRIGQHRLLLLWSVFTLVGTAIVLIQTSATGAYATHGAEIWDWFLPTVVPTLSLMMGTVAADAHSPDDAATLDAFAFRMAFACSAVYLLLVFFFLLLYAQSADPVTALKGSSKVVTTVYAIVGVAIGSLFVSKKSG